jgi:ElaB protein
MDDSIPENGFQFSKERNIYAQKAKEINRRAREKYLEQITDVKEKLKLVSDDAGTKAKDAIDKMSIYATENPQKAALITLGVGFGLGLLVGSFLRRR